MSVSMSLCVQYCIAIQVFEKPRKYAGTRILETRILETKLRSSAILIAADISV